MKHGEFAIGRHFVCGDHRWLCTDVGSRVIVAVRADTAEIAVTENGVTRREVRDVTPRDLAGPPYFLAEQVFDEDELPGCTPV
jgi:hypothetical protein